MTGTVSPHSRFLLREHLTQIEHLERAVERITAEIARRFSPPDPPENPEHSPSEENLSKEEAPEVSQPTLPPSKRGLSWEEAVVLLMSIPGISDRAAFGILAEIGVNMQQFPTASHLASWAGVYCPGNNESAGKRLSGKTRKGNPWLRRLLLQAAHVVARQKHGYLTAQFHRIAARGEKKRAGMTVAHSILVIIYHLLDEGVPMRNTERPSLRNGIANSLRNGSFVNLNG